MNDSLWPTRMFFFSRIQLGAVCAFVDVLLPTGAAKTVQVDGAEKATFKQARLHRTLKFAHATALLGCV